LDGKLAVIMTDVNRDATSAFSVVNSTQRRHVDATTPVYVHITRCINSNSISIRFSVRSSNMGFVNK